MGLRHVGPMQTVGDALNCLPPAEHPGIEAWKRPITSNQLLFSNRRRCPPIAFRSRHVDGRDCRKRLDAGGWTPQSYEATNAAAPHLQ